MKVRELVEMLQRLDQDMLVLLENTEGDTVPLRPEYIRPNGMFTFGDDEAFGPQTEKHGGVSPDAVRCLWFFA